MEEILKVAANGQWSLEKKVREPHLPEADFQGAGQGVVPHHKDAKYQGGDPRHANDVMSSTHYRGPKDKQGNIRPVVSGSEGGKLKGVTSGQSSLRSK